MVKRESLPYGAGGTGSNFVDFLADQIAEPSDPESTVDVMTEMPARWAEFYADEATVTAAGEKDAAILAEIDSRYCRVVGNMKEWVRYHHRPDVSSLWSWHPPEDIKSPCAVAAVKKKAPGALRKILAVCPKN